MPVVVADLGEGPAPLRWELVLLRKSAVMRVAGIGLEAAHHLQFAVAQVDGEMMTIHLCKWIQ